MRSWYQDWCLEIERGDITAQETEAVVNAANRELAPGGGVAGAIHRAAGPGLWEECKGLGGCATGEAKITGGHALPARYVVHTVGPVYDNEPNPADLLARSYRNSLFVADENGAGSVAFPALSTGAFGYPMGEAAEIAVRTLMKTLPALQSVRLTRLVLRGAREHQVHMDAARRIAAELGWAVAEEGG
ncbi:macro domain-containing protein [Thiohalorhabdus sp. Cl-TMA]|uniref:Macro domain-containing protein n=1 Tax=Thiohalorhabdus methylotrophus TaxID=3242694 RepID=A0ABV4TZJ7_9GAMM